MVMMGSFSLDIFSEEIKQNIEISIVHPVISGDYTRAMSAIPGIQENLYANIPDDKRASYGRYYTVKILSQYLFNRLEERGSPVLDVGATIFEIGDSYMTKGVCLGLISYYGTRYPEGVLPYYEIGAGHEHWELREFAAAFFRKLIKAHPNKIRVCLLALTQSEDPKLRRFVSETLRPVAENRWIHKDPEFSLSILRNLFHERDAYPRASVGNNLSDLSKRNPDLVFRIVEELVHSGERNANWIAHRACRNLVKKDPARVMDVLGVDRYQYKQRVYLRKDLTKQG